MMPRRRWLESVLAAVAVFTAGRRRPAQADAAELKVPDTATTETVDFETRGIEGWTSVTSHTIAAPPA